MQLIYLGQLLDLYSLNALTFLFAAALIIFLLICQAAFHLALFPSASLSSILLLYSSTLLSLTSSIPLSSS